MASFINVLFLLQINYSEYKSKYLLQQMVYTSRLNNKIFKIIQITGHTEDEKNLKLHGKSSQQTSIPN